MWYLIARSWKPELREQVRPLVEMEAAAVDSADMGWAQGIDEARVHGNPLLETATVRSHESVENKRAEITAFKAEGVADFMGLVGEAYLRNEGLYLIDVDDPELIEFGEDGIHERLTSHLVEFVTDAPNDPEWSSELVDATLRYIDNCFFCNIDSGAANTAVALAVQVFRDYSGLPYEWFGAPID